MENGSLISFSKYTKLQQVVLPQNGMHRVQWRQTNCFMIEWKRLRMENDKVYSKNTKIITSISFYSYNIILSTFKYTKRKTQ